SVKGVRIGQRGQNRSKGSESVKWIRTLKTTASVKGVRTLKTRAVTPLQVPNRRAEAASVASSPSAGRCSCWGYLGIWYSCPDLSRSCEKVQNQPLLHRAHWIGIARGPTGNYGVARRVVTDHAPNGESVRPQRDTQRFARDALAAARVLVAIP